MGRYILYDSLYLSLLGQHSLAPYVLTGFLKDTVTHNRKHIGAGSQSRVAPLMRSGYREECPFAGYMQSGIGVRTLRYILIANPLGLWFVKKIKNIINHNRSKIADFLLVLAFN